MNQIYSVGRSSYSLFAISVLLAALALFPATAAYAHDDNDKSNSNKSGSGLPAQAGVEVNLSSNGSALVRGAKVTGISGSTINATTNYGSSQLSWTVKTDDNTEFNANKGGTSGLSGIAVGDTLSFSGSLDQAASGLTVNAKVVKDWTHSESKKTLSGIVTSINATLNSFTISHDLPAQAGNATTSVQTDSNTKFKLSNGNDGSFTSIFLNAKVKVKGMFNASSSVLTATSVDISTSTKKWGWDKDDKKEWRDWIRSKVWLNW